MVGSRPMAPVRRNPLRPGFAPRSAPASNSCPLPLRGHRVPTRLPLCCSSVHGVAGRRWIQRMWCYSPCTRGHRERGIASQSARPLWGSNGQRSHCRGASRKALDSHRISKNAVVLCVHHYIAFAGTLLQPGPVEDGSVTTGLLRRSAFFSVIAASVTLSRRTHRVLKMSACVITVSGQARHLDHRRLW